MLHYESVSPELVTTLKKIIAEPWFKSFRLAGGTALAFKHGHRESVDIDLFSNIAFDNQELILVLRTLFDKGSIIITKENKIGVSLIANNVKIDLLCWRDIFFDPPEMIEGIPFFNDKEIFAMKLAAIGDRAARKDFIDLFMLLESYTLKEGLDFYNLKYPFMDINTIFTGLRNYKRADSDESPKMIKYLDITWSEIKEKIENEVQQYFINLTLEKEIRLKLRDDRLSRLIEQRKKRPEE